MPQKDPAKYREYQKDYKRRMRSGERDADDRDQLLELLRSKDEQIARLLSIIEGLTPGLTESVNLLSISQARTEAGIDKDRQDSVNPASIQNGRIDKDRQNLSIPESGLTGLSQSGVNPNDSENRSGITVSRNGLTRDRQKIDSPYKEDVVEEEENIKTNNNINNNKNAGAPSAGAPSAGAPSAGAHTDTRTIARLRHAVDGVKPASEAPRLVGKCPYETTLGAEKLRQFTETVQKRFPDINGLTWTVKQLRHAYQQVGDATLEELTAAFREYFRAMDATRNGPKGLTSIDGWTRTTLATAISDAKLASEYAESGT